MIWPATVAGIGSSLRVRTTLLRLKPSPYSSRRGRPCQLQLLLICPPKIARGPNELLTNAMCTSVSYVFFHKGFCHGISFSASAHCWCIQRFTARFTAGSFDFVGFPFSSTRYIFVALRREQLTSTGRHCEFYTMMRDPMDRLVSAFFYCKYRHRSSAHSVRTIG